MMMNKRAAVAAAALLGVTSMAPDARADRIDLLLTGLGSTGFDVRGGHNPLSGGFNLTAVNNFAGQEFDFGAWEFALAGPISVQVQTGGRVFDQLEFRVTTAVNPTGTASPLSYTSTIDTGNQQSNINGSLLIDADVTLNRFGFYDVEVTYSSRQTLETAGRYSAEIQQFDSDFGPVQIRGNLYADILAVATEPIFQAIGVSNIFADFSASSQIQAETAAKSLQLEQLLAQASDPILREFGLGVSPFEESFSEAGQVAPIGAVVPEPGAILLLLAGIPALMLRKWRGVVRPV